MKRTAVRLNRVTVKPFDRKMIHGKIKKERENREAGYIAVAATLPGDTLFVTVKLKSLPTLLTPLTQFRTSHRRCDTTSTSTLPSMVTTLSYPTNLYSPTKWF